MASIKDYQIENEIGRGSFGIVYKAHSKQSSTNYAIKCISKENISKAISENIISEIQILQNIKNHQNIIKMQNFDWDRKYVYIIMEYCAGGDLSNCIKNSLHEEDIKYIFKQIVSGILFLFFQKIIHFDLKPQNILFLNSSSFNIKIADFGLAKALKETSPSSPGGTPLYMAPEVVKGSKYEERVDLWSLGIILYECVFTKTPFDGLSKLQVLTKLKNFNGRLNIPMIASPGCRKVLQGLLVSNPSERMSHVGLAESDYVALEISKNDAKKSDKENFRSKKSLQNMDLDYIIDHLKKAKELECEERWREALQMYKYWLPKLVDVMRAENLDIRRLVEYYMRRAENCAEKVGSESKGKGLIKTLGIALLFCLALTIYWWLIGDLIQRKLRGE